VAKYCHPPGSFLLATDHITLFFIYFLFAAFLHPSDPQDPGFSNAEFLGDFFVVQALHRFSSTQTSPSVPETDLLHFPGVIVLTCPGLFGPIET